MNHATLLEVYRAAYGEHTDAYLNELILRDEKDIFTKLLTFAIAMESGALSDATAYVVESYLDDQQIGEA